MHISRVAAEARYPARFQLVLAASPCPCGNFGVQGAECWCIPSSVRRYVERLSGPILVRIDIQQKFSPMRRSALAIAAAVPGGSSGVVAARVVEARCRQARWLAGSGWFTNGEVSGGHLRRCLPVPAGVEMLDDAVCRGKLSARGVDKVVRVVWTISDQLYQVLSVRRTTCWGSGDEVG